MSERSSMIWKIGTSFAASRPATAMTTMSDSQPAIQKRLSTGSVAGSSKGCEGEPPARFVRSPGR